MATYLTAPPGESGGQTFSYTHFLSVVMPHDSVGPRFERARDACLRDATLNCKLISASLSERSYSRSNTTEASLQVALPHDKIAVFEKNLLAPVPQDGSGKAAVQTRSTNAENVGSEVVNIDRKIAQLTSYRDKLVELAKRPSLSVDDAIKIVEKLSKVQGDLDETLAQKRDVDERVARERLNISLIEKAELMSPIAQVWRGGIDTFVESTANALEFLIRALPWVPIVIAGLFLILLPWRLLRRKKPAASA